MSRDDQPTMAGKLAGKTPPMVPRGLFLTWRQASTATQRLIVAGQRRASCAACLIESWFGHLSPGARTYMHLNNDELMRVDGWARLGRFGLFRRRGCLQIFHQLGTVTSCTMRSSVQ